MAAPLRFDAMLGFLRSGLWFGQVITAFLLLLVVGLADLSLVTWVSESIRSTTIVLVGGALVACAALRILVSTLLLTVRGMPTTDQARTSIGIRLLEVLVTCAATGLFGLVALGTPVTGNFDRFAVAVGTSQFSTLVLVLVLAVLVVVNATGSAVFGLARRAA